MNRWIVEPDRITRLIDEATPPRFNGSTIQRFDQRMFCLDLSLPTPAENLACDEALLDYCETAGAAEGWLRFWETQTPFVVVGYANPVATEVNVPACQQAGVPVLRRCSGGGTVLQGPGCLNYALVLRIEPGGPLQSIASANRFIMEKNRSALEALLRSARGTSVPAVEIHGHTDLTLDRLKFSGNAQRRRRKFLLFHGTLLLRFDMALVEKWLRLPARQPGYRRSRPHQDFLTNLNLPAAAAKQALCQAWAAYDEPEFVPLEAIAELARQKYLTTQWNFRF